MIRVLVTGASGFIGSALVRSLLRDQRYRPIAAIRRKATPRATDVDCVTVGDLDGEADWSPALEDVDVVIHAAARVHVTSESSDDPLAEFRKVNLQGTMNLARQAADRGVKRFVFISSVKVNGEASEIGHPFQADDVPGPEDPYGISKAEAEQALLELAEASGMDVVIVRPVLVYGPGVKANFQRMLTWISRGVPLPLGRINNKRSLVALDNLVDLIIVCIDHPMAANQILLVSDGEDVSTTELLQRVGRSLGRRPYLIPVPVFLINLLAGIVHKKELSRRLTGNLQVDITKTRELLNWEPPVRMDDALQATARSFLQGKAGQSAD